jgi:hypothetical protein
MGVITARWARLARQRLIVQAFIDRRVRLFVRIPDSRIVRYYQHHQ